MIAALALAAALGAVPFQREMKDWIAVCDNGRSCTLKAIPSLDSRDEATGLVITVTRKAGPAEPPSVEVWADDQKAIDPRALRLDGKPLPPLAWAVDKSEAYDVSLEGADALRLLRLLRDGRALTLGAGKDAPGASLDGAAAAFLAMDDAQGRVGGVTALARPGPAPASAVPPPPALPVIVVPPRPPPLKTAKAFALAVRRARAADLKESDCDDPRAPNDGDSADALNATEAVVTLYCHMAAYQGNALAFRAPIASPAGARPLVLPPLPGQPKGEASDNQFVDPEFDADTATFTSSAKGRGPGDCGASMSWTYDGRTFRPSALSEQGRCGGQEGDWPDVWRTDVRLPPKRR